MAPRDFGEDGAFGAFGGNGDFGAPSAGGGSFTFDDSGAGPGGAIGGGHGYGFDSTGAPSPWQIGDQINTSTGRKYDFQPMGSTLKPGQSSRQGNTIFTNGSGAPGPAGLDPFGQPFQARDWNPSQMNMGSIMHANGGPVMSYAEGGAIEDPDVNDMEGAQPDRLPSYSEDPGEEPTSEPQQRDPSQFMGAIADAGKQTPLEGVKQFPGNVKRIVSYLMGEGAEHPQALDQAGAQVDPQGQMSADDRNLLAVQKAAEAGGPEAAWKLVQANRVAYNAKQAFAYAALNGTQQKPGDLNAAVDAANQAAPHVLDGSSVKFMPAQGGVTATVTSPGAAQPQVFNLSADQFRKYLNVGGDGQWDRVMQKTIPQTLAALSQGQAGAISRLDQQKPMPNARPQQAPAGEPDTSSQLPQAGETNFGKTPSTINMSGSDRVQTPEPDKTGFDEQLRARAARIFPGDEAARQQWMAAQEERGLERENKLGIAEETGKRRVEAAQVTGQGRVQAADVAGQHKTAGWKYASDAKQAVAQIAADQKAAHEGNVDARARIESARKAIATKRMTAATISPEDEALEKALTQQGAAANQRPAGQQAPAPQRQGAAQQPPVQGAKLYKGQWYTRGPNGESVPVQ